MTGLPLGTPVVAGGGDCAAQAVGSSIVEEEKYRLLQEQVA